MLILTALYFTLSASASPEDEIGVISLPVIHNTADSTLLTKVEVLSELIREHVERSHTLFLANPWFGTDTVALDFNETNGRFSDEEASALAYNTGASVVLKTDVDFADSLAEVSLTAIELGSGITIDRHALKLYVAGIDESTAPEPLSEALDGIVRACETKTTAHGYPFADEEIGVLFISPHDTSALSRHWPDLVEVLLRQIDALEIPRVRIKDLPLRDDEGARSGVQLADAGRALNARIIVAPDDGYTTFSDSTNAVSFFFLDPESRSVGERRIPLTPERGPFARAILPVSEFSEFAVPSTLLAGRLLYETGHYETAWQFFALIDTLMLGTGIELPWIKFLSAQAQHGFVRTHSANSLDRLEKSAAAAADYDYCLEQAELSEDSLSKAYILFNAADNEQFRGNWQEAIQSFEKARILFAREEKTREEILAYGMMGGIHRYLGDWQRARETYDANVIIAQDAGDTSSLAEAYGNLAMLLDVMQQPDSALIAYSQSYSLRQSLVDEYGMAELHGRMGIAFKNIGKLDSASQHLHKQAEIGLRLKSEPILSKSYFNLGIITRDAGRPEEALEYFKKSLEQMELMGDFGGASRALNNIGALHHELGDTTAALTYYEKSLENARELDDAGLLVRAYTNIADIHCERGDFDTALALYNSAINRAEKADDAYSLASALFAKGLLRIKTGRITEGYLLVKRAVNVGETVDVAAFAQQRELLERLEQLVGEVK